MKKVEMIEWDNKIGTVLSTQNPIEFLFYLGGQQMPKSKDVNVLLSQGITYIITVHVLKSENEKDIDKIQYAYFGADKIKLLNQKETKKILKEYKKWRKENVDRNS